MVQSPHRITPKEALEVLRAAGIPEAALTPAVQAVAESEQASRLVTLDEAAEMFGITYARLERWVQRGHLVERGRQPFAARGGGKILVSVADVARLIENPPKAGRPRKSV